MKKLVFLAVLAMLAVSCVGTDDFESIQKNQNTTKTNVKQSDSTKIGRFAESDKEVDPKDIIPPRR